MKMVSMKLSAAAREEQVSARPADVEGPQYPWGLSLNLEDDAMKKLGMSKDMPEVGTELLLFAKVKVTSCSMSSSEGGGERSSCQLQITDMMLAPKPAKSNDDAAEKLYGKG